MDLYFEIDAAEGAVETRTGTHRPIPLVPWRDHFIGGREIGDMRARLLEEWAKGDPTLTVLVEAEYKDAKKRERRLIVAGPKWDARNGLTELREKSERAAAARHAAVELLSETIPTTVGGCAALVGAALSRWWGLPAATSGR